MTSNELRRQLNETYGIEKEWPDKIEVDHETYANCCQEVFNWSFRNRDLQWRTNGGTSVELELGPNHGLMFKNVELILEKK